MRLCLCTAKSEGPAECWPFSFARSPFIAARASLFFVEHGVVDGLGLTVFSSIGGDPRLSVGRDHDVSRERGFAAVVRKNY